MPHNPRPTLFSRKDTDPRVPCKDLDPNPTVYNRLRRLELSCPHCPPHKAENAPRRARHGHKKPKRKDKHK